MLVLLHGGQVSRSNDGRSKNYIACVVDALDIKAFTCVPNLIIQPNGSVILLCIGSFINDVPYQVSDTIGCMESKR